MELRSQRELAARIMKCGKSRVWIDPTRLGDVSQAIISEDIRRLIRDGVIKKIQKKGLSGFRKTKMRIQKSKGRRRGVGSKKGKLGSRKIRKREWINRVRAQRKLMKELLKDKKISKKSYKILYRKTKGGFFRSRAHMLAYVERELKRTER